MIDIHCIILFLLSLLLLLLLLRLCMRHIYDNLLHESCQNQLSLYRYRHPCQQFLEYV